MQTPGIQAAGAVLWRRLSDELVQVALIHRPRYGDWSFPKGKVEAGESEISCAFREVLEETNIKIKNIKFGAVTNDIFENEEKHFITIFMVCDYDSGEVKIMEPDKCETLEWMNWEDIPEPLLVFVVFLVFVVTDLLLL